MADLKSFAADAQTVGFAAHRTAEYGAPMPKSMYIAVALVMAGAIPDVGGAFTPLTNPVTATPLVVGGDTMPAIAKNLAFQGKAWFLGDGLIASGKMGKPSEMKEAMPFGSRLDQRTTGEIRQKAEFMVKDTFLNTRFWNSVRSGALGPVDVLLFTNRTVQILRYGDHSPVIMEIGSEVAGNYEAQITGGFAVGFTAIAGEIDPLDGVKLADLKFESLKYTFAAATPAPTNLALIAGTTSRYTMNTGTAAKIQRQVVETGDVRYSIFKNTKDAIPTAEPVTINTDTGEVNILGTLPVGRYNYRVYAENSTGVSGWWPIEIVAKVP